jgi:hypothetical protein
MGLECGIVGLPQVGKSPVFKAQTKPDTHILIFKLVCFSSHAVASVSH